MANGTGGGVSLPAETMWEGWDPAPFLGRQAAWTGPPSREQYGAGKGSEAPGGTEALRLTGFQRLNTVQETSATASPRPGVPEFQASVSPVVLPLLVSVAWDALSGWRGWLGAPGMAEGLSLPAPPGTRAAQVPFLNINEQA